MNIPYAFKKCTKCNEWLVAYHGNFCKKNKNKNRYGMNSVCKKCASIDRKKYYQENKDKTSSNNKEFKKNNKDYFKQYYLNNKEYIDNKHKEYRENNKEKENARDKEYKKTPRGKVSKINSQFKIRAVSFGLENIDDKITTEQYIEMINFFKNKCAYSGKALTDINSTTDHIQPISKNGRNVPWNIVPCDREINTLKLDKDFNKWYIGTKFFSTWRLKKISQWQEYAKSKWGNS